MPPAETIESLTETLKISAAALRDAGVPFALGGSVGAWARGGPEPRKDLDLMVKPDDAEKALRALEGIGMRTERPPEEWLYKAWYGDVLIDVIFRPSGLELTDEVLARAQTISVMAVSMPVMALEDMLVTMLYALDEHALDYSGLLAIARSLREQIEWPALRARVDRSPYGKAFFTLVQELGFAPPSAKGRPDGSSNVRVLHAGT